MSVEGYRNFVVIPGALGFPPSLFLRRPGSRDEALCRVGEHGRDWAPHEKLRRAEVGGTTDDIIEVSPAVGRGSAAGFDRVCRDARRGCSAEHVVEVAVEVAAGVGAQRQARRALLRLTRGVQGQ